MCDGLQQIKSQRYFKHESDALAILIRWRQICVIDVVQQPIRTLQCYCYNTQTEDLIFIGVDSIHTVRV